MSKKNRRTKYDSPRTKYQLDNLPDWINKQPETDLWKLLNTPNILIDELNQFLSDTVNNLLPNTYLVNDRNPIYISNKTPQNPTAQYSAEGGTISITKTDELEDFIYGPPTRISNETGNAEVLDSLTRAPIDVHYVEDLSLDYTNDSLAESGAVFTVLQENAFSDHDAIVFFDRNWIKVGETNVDRQIQDYDNQPVDEWIDIPESGVVNFELNYYPLKDTLSIKNALSLDDWGNAQEVPTTYSESGKYVTLAHNIYGSGMFIAEYEFIPHKTLRSFGMSDYRGLISVQNPLAKFKDALITTPTDDVDLEPTIGITIDPNDTHSILRTLDRMEVAISDTPIYNDKFYLTFSPDNVRPGMDILVNYTNSDGVSSQHLLQAEKIPNAFVKYKNLVCYNVGVEVTSIIGSDILSLHKNNFRASRYLDYTSTIQGMEPHIYDQGEIAEIPEYRLDRVGQYIAEYGPESGSFVYNNMIGHTYQTSNLPDLSASYPELADIVFTTGKIVDPSLSSDIPISARRWGSWIVVLRRKSAPQLDKPYRRFLHPVNLNESGYYELAFIDVDTFDEYTTLDLNLNFNPTSFTIDDREIVHILGYKEEAMADALTNIHTIDIDSSMNITLPGEVVNRYDKMRFRIDIPTPSASVHVKHIPSDTFMYSNQSTDAGTFMADGWGSYIISGEYNSTFFSSVFEVEPSTNKKIMRQEVHFHYDYAISIPIDDDYEVVYFRERYPNGVDKEIRDA